MEDKDKFFKVVKSSKPRIGPISSMDKIFAKKLYETLLSRGRISHKVSIEKEADNFRLLREKDKIEEKVVAKVLSFYCDETIPHKRLFPPQISSSKGFRDKWTNLYDYMLKNQKPEISLVTKEIIKLLKKEKHWPKGSDRSLPESVQLSIDCYSKWYDDFVSFKRKLTEQFNTSEKPSNSFYNQSESERRDWYRVRNLVNYMNVLECNLILEPERFILNWFLEFHKRIEGFDKWGGSLKNAIFDLQSAGFHAIFSDFTFKHYGFSGNWTELGKSMGFIKED